MRFWCALFSKRFQTMLWCCKVQSHSLFGLLTRTMRTIKLVTCHCLPFFRQTWKYHETLATYLPLHTINELLIFLPEWSWQVQNILQNNCRNFQYPSHQVYASWIMCYTFELALCQAKTEFEKCTSHQLFQSLLI